MFSIHAHVCVLHKHLFTKQYNTHSPEMRFVLQFEAGPVSCPDTQLLSRKEWGGGSTV